MSNFFGTAHHLQYNSGATRFANYLDSFNQGKPIYLLPWVESTEPTLIVSESSKTVDAAAESVTFEYIARNIEGDVTAAEESDTDNIITNVSAADGVVTVTLTPNTEDKEKTATVILSATGAESVTLTITQRAYVAAGTEIVTTFDFATMEIDNQTAIVNLELDGITLSGDQGSHNNAKPTYYSSDHTVRLYSGNTFTISGGTIKSIEFTFERGGDKLSANVGSYSTPTWTGESNEIKFDVNGSVRIEKIVITHVL